MTIALANTTSSSWTSAAGSQSVSVVHAVGEGFLVGIYFEYSFGSPDGISSVVWDPTGDNQSLTLLQLQQSNVNNRYLAMYYLAVPTSTKTGNLVVTFGGSNNDLGAIIVRHITGHDTAAMIRASDKATHPTPTLNPSITLASASGDLVIDFMFYREDAAALSPDAPQANGVEASPAGHARTLSSSTTPGASSVTHSYTNAVSGGGAFDDAMTIASITPGAAPPPPPAVLFRRGQMFINEDLILI